MKSVLGILCFALLMSPLAADACPHSKSKAKMAKHSQSVYPVVVHLESRDQKITVSSGVTLASRTASPCPVAVFTYR